MSWFNQTKPQNGLGIVDLDRVSKQLGRQSEMESNLREKIELAQNKLMAIEKDANEQLAAARKGLGENPTKESVANFQRMQQSASVQFGQLKLRAEQELNALRQQLVSDFREQSRPVVEEIAKKHGFTTVMTRNDMFLFSYEKAVDITDEVAERMAAIQPPKKAAEPAQATPSATAAPASDVAETSKEAGVQQVNYETK
ncbi:OmpH family outer membrane protein [Planctomicrobium sp. SH668]|uniref:OmpH family outer membrane protein n=1 Tax=Planctomicrobium sp. SH668 TaxID=3448126 RepID=UPI003F5B584C